MIKTFRGNDPLYAEMYHTLAATLKHEEGIKLYPPNQNELYIYWDNKEYFAHGGVQLIYDTVLYQYILKNIVFFIDFELYSSPVDDEKYYLIYDQIGRKFYKDIYLELGKIVRQVENDPRYLLLEIPKNSLSDCLNRSGWPIQEQPGLVDQHYDTLLRGLDSEYQQDYLNRVKCSDYRVLLDLKISRQQKSHNHLNVQSYPNLEKPGRGFVLSTSQQKVIS